MNNGTAKRSASKKPGGRASAHFRSLLVPVDLTPSSDRVLGRLALVPLADDARVTLLHVVPGNLPPAERRGAESDARKALAREARHLSKSLRRTIRVEPLVTSGAPPKEIAKSASAVRAELIVMGRGGGRALRDAFLGSTAERVIRRSKLPVLVVRLAPRADYSRPALALDLDQAAHEVIGLMLRVIRPPRPYVQVIHAFDAPYERLAYPSVSEAVIERRRDELQRKASRDLSKLLASSLARVNVPPEQVPRWKHHIRFGSPRVIIRKAVQKADTDLLVLGTHGYAGVAHVLLGTVAGDVLRDVTCDVLVVPPRPAKR